MTQPTSPPDREQQLMLLVLDVVRLRRCLGYFLNDSRFHVSVGGNPNAVDGMLAYAKRVYEETK